MTAAGVYDFEGIDETLPYIPIAARRVLDALGRKLPLDGWLELPLADRRRIVAAGLGAAVDERVATIVDPAAVASIQPPPEPDAALPPPALLAALGPSRAIDAARWKTLSALDRYALVKCAPKPEKLARAHEEIVGGHANRVSPPLTHLTSAGEAHMVDVGSKPVTARRAVASACVRTTREVVERVASGAAAKGDVLAAARVAGILASKRTPELIPLCHPVQTTHAAIELETDAAGGEIRVRATVEAVDRTGVEMEAMVAASVASLTVYDMIKGVDRWATIERVRLEEKSGGKSGAVRRP
jgi:cyclic pyranopterin phosphate synthase